MDLESVELHFHQFGSGPPVVILHGLFGSSRNWQSVARDLAEKFFVVTVDLRNHGSSPPPFHTDELRRNGSRRFHAIAKTRSWRGDHDRP